MKKLFTFFLFALLPLVASAQVYIDGLYYVLSSDGSNTAAVVPKPNYKQYHGDINIPASVINGSVTYSVTSIEDWAFNFADITSVIIPNSVTSIGQGAFVNCENLTEIIIPASVTSIGIGILNGCKGLETVKVENGNPNYDSRGDCNAIIETNSNTLIAGCKKTVIPNSVTNIGKTAFSGCESLTSIMIPTSVTAIDSCAFYNCKSLPSITIPKTVISIGEEVLARCSGLESIEVENGNPNYDSRGDCNAIIETNSNTLIAGCKKTVIPNSVTTIGKSAFSNCESLTSIIIPNSVTSIGEYSFQGCSGLQKVIIGKGVTSIGNRAFSYCIAVTEITSKAINPPTLGECVFGEYDWDRIDKEVCKLYVPKGSKASYQAAEQWKDFKEIVELVEDVLVSISSAKQVAYCSDKDLDFTDKPELKAYVATGYDKTTGTIWLTRVKDVPANTGFLLMGEAGDYNVPIKEGGSSSYYKNMFKGTLEKITLQTTETIGGKEYTNYYLSSGDKGVGFYKVTKTEGQSLNANRAYLPIPSDIPAVGTAGGTETIKVSGAGQVPYYSANSLDFTNMADVKAYTATGYDYEKGTIWLTRVKKVPALTGILIMAPEGSYPIPTTSVATVYENMFMGTLEAMTLYTTLTTEDGKEYTNYYLSNGEQGVGFYKVTKPEGVSLGANRCYLPIPKQSAGTRSIDDDPTNFNIQESDEVIGLRVFGSADGTTDIETNNREPLTNNHWYNLQGQRVENPSKGLYIKNGKKVIIR